MPNADWKKCAVCTALPTVQTRASQPETGNGSVESSCSTRPTSCLSWSRSSSASRSSSLRIWSRLMAPPPCAQVREAGHTSRRLLRKRYAEDCPIGWFGLALRLFCWADCAAMDSLDVALLTALREHPRAGDLELSRLLGVARGTVSARLQRLEQAGVVTGHGPDVDVAAAGYGVQAFVTLEIAQGALDAVRHDLEAIPGVLEAHATTGQGDVLCRVAARSHEALQQVLVELGRSPNVVRSTSVIALSVLVPFRTLPLLAAEAAPGAGRSSLSR